MLRTATTLTMAAALACFTSLRTHADQIDLTVEIPRLNVSEYHRPYVAIWIHDEHRQVVANLAVWYQMTTTQEGAGTKWLPDLRQWWRRSGRSLQVPIDGVTGATRPAGEHQLTFSARQSGLAKLPPGDYALIVEAVREVGGRELIEIPFSWPIEKTRTFSATGSEELGAIKLTIKP